MDAILEELIDQFGFAAVSLTTAPRGFVAETYFVDAKAPSSTASTRYFLKVFRNARLAQNIPYAVGLQAELADTLETKSGSPVIPRPVTTTTGHFVFTVRGAESLGSGLSGRVESTEHTAVLYQHLPGSTTRAFSWERYFGVLCEIYRTSLDLQQQLLPPLVEHFTLLDERLLQTLESYYLEYTGEDTFHCLVRDYLRPYATAIQRHWQHWQRAAERCRGNTGPFYITHGDGPGNVMQNGDALYIVDWDELRWAPLERDTWFHAFDPEQRRLLQTVLCDFGLSGGFRTDFLHYYAAKRFFDDLLDFLEGIYHADDETTKRNLFDGLVQDCFGWTFPILEDLVANSF